MNNVKDQQAERLGSVITSISESRAKQSKSSPTEEKGICECGSEIEGVYFAELGKTFYSQQCRECNAESKRKLQEEKVKQSRLCRQRELTELLGRVIPRRYENAHMDDLPVKWQEKFFELMPNRGAYLYGSPGVGKTYSLCAIAKELITEGHSARRVVWERLTLDIRNTYKSNQKSERDLIQPLIDCDVLIIEDVGTTTSLDNMESDFNLRTLLTILDSRLEACRPMWFSSNKSPEQLAETFDDRIASRLHEHCKIILLDGTDRRKMSKRSD
jgi:DNA replication protein DnaC